MKKTFFIIASVGCFSLASLSKASTDEVSLTSTTTQYKSSVSECPIGPYPIQPIGPVAGSIRFKQSTSEATVTVWRYPCSNSNSIPVATIEVHKGQIVVSGSYFTLKETGTPKSPERALLSDYINGAPYMHLSTKKSFVAAPTGMNLNAALTFSLDFYYNFETGLVETISIEIPPYRPEDYGATAQPGPTHDYTGQWVNPGEDAWGVTVLQNFPSNSRYIFVPWYTYDTSGKASWYIFQGDNWLANDVFSATVSLYTGSPWGQSYQNGAIRSRLVGTAKLTFTSLTTARFEYVVDGVSKSMNLVKLQ